MMEPVSAIYMIFLILIGPMNNTTGHHVASNDIENKVKVQNEQNKDNQITNFNDSLIIIYETERIFPSKDDIYSLSYLINYRLRGGSFIEAEVTRDGRRRISVKLPKVVEDKELGISAIFYITKV